MTVLEQLRKTIEDGHPGETEKLVREALKQHIPAGRIVEEGSLRQVFSNPLHPYTVGLFRCIPDIEDENASIESIAGMMPDPLALPPACAFHPRCPEATESCWLIDPNEVEVEKGHRVLCNKYVTGGGVFR